MCNDVPLGVIMLNRAGPQTRTLASPAAALVPPGGDDRHQLYVKYQNDRECSLEHQTGVVIGVASRFTFPHRLTAPATNLAHLPRPIYQRSFLPERALIVVPDEPSAAEMQAALTVAAAFGRMTEGNLALNLAPASVLKPQDRAGAHLIAVGRADRIPWLAQVRLPAPPGESGFEVAGADSDDGIIQMAPSPWNRAGVVLVAGGNTDAAVVKAAQALSWGAVRTGTETGLAVVKQVTPASGSEVAVPVNRTLAGLGYLAERLEGAGSHTAEYTFFVPPDRAVAQDASFNIVFTHSALLDYNKSGVIVSLNGEPVGSIRFTAESAGLNETQIALPGAAIRPGLNRLAVRADLTPLSSCGRLQEDGAWFTVRPESVLHLPLNAGENPAARPSTLSQYPLPFILDPALGRTTIVVSAADPASWGAAAQLAADLGH
ncbi:MAG: cellulose biosynthesis cyclic di-GMP-binding regulatory protein BcsB [Anaerolineae bacterium]